MGWRRNNRSDYAKVLTLLEANNPRNKFFFNGFVEKSTKETIATTCAPTGRRGGSLSADRVEQQRWGGMKIAFVQP